MVVTVKGLGHLAVLGCPYDDVITLKVIEIEGMHGLTQLKTYIIRNINDVVDGPHAGGKEPLCHPGGGRTDNNIFNCSGTVTVAEIRCFDIDLGHIVRIEGSLLFELGGNGSELLSHGDSRLSAEPLDGEAVGSVGSDLEVDGDEIVKV